MALTRRIALFLSTAVLAAGLVAAPSFAETTYKVGSTPTGVPFTFLDVKTNTIEGMMVDLIKEIGKEAGFTADVQSVPFAALIPSLTGGKIDIIAAAMIATEKRKEVIAFSQPVLPYGEGLVVSAKDPKSYTSFADLKGDVVGVQSGTLYVDALQKAGGFKEIKSYDSLADLLRDVDLGRIKGGFGDKPILAYQISQKKFPNVRLASTYESVAAGDLAIGVRKGDDELLGKINTALAKLKANGEIDRLMAKWNLK